MSKELIKQIKKACGESFISLKEGEKEEKIANMKKVYSLLTEAEKQMGVEIPRKKSPRNLGMYLKAVERMKEEETFLPFIVFFGAILRLTETNRYFKDIKGIPTKE